VLRDGIKRILTTDLASGIRSLTWSRLDLIIEEADKWSSVIQDVTNWDTRRSLAESFFVIAYLRVWQGLQEITEMDVKNIAAILLSETEIEEHEDDETALLNRIFDEMIMIDSNKKHMTIIEICNAIQSGKIESTEKHEGDKLIDGNEADEFRKLLERYGIRVLNEEGDLAISNNSHQIMRIIERSRGYARIFWRLENVKHRSKTVSMAGRSTRCTILKGAVMPKQKKELGY
jgi:hypothetical protein